MKPVDAEITADVSFVAFEIFVIARWAVIQ